MDLVGGLLIRIDRGTAARKIHIAVVTVKRLQLVVLHNLREVVLALCRYVDIVHDVAGVGQRVGGSWVRDDAAVGHREELELAAGLREAY